MMNDDLLGTYLNDHLAGSVLAIETIVHCRDHNAPVSLKPALEALRIEIEEDRTVLKELIERVEAKQAIAKKAVAWLAEKASRVKVGGFSNEPEQVAFLRLQQLDLLYTGVSGKLALWKALEAVAANDARISLIDLESLTRRAESQLRRIEEYRIEAAREAFLNQTPT
jgi:hypothetical protein